MRYPEMASAFVAVLALAGAAWAEDPAGAATNASAPAAITAEPSEMMPNAAQSVLLGVVDSGLQLIAVGSRGHILLSNDGSRWKQVPSPVRSTLTAVNFVDMQNGWAVGHDTTILHSDSAGATWEVQNFQPELEKPLLDVLFLDTSHGFAVGAYGLFLQTQDGGAHWGQIDAPAILADGLHLYSIRKLGNGDLLVAGEQGLVGLSVDGGKTWTRLATGYSGTFFGATPVGIAGVVLCGLRGNAYLAANVRSPAWHKIDTGTTDSFYSCASVDDGNVVMGGVNGTVLLVNTQTLKATRVADPVSSALSAVLPWKNNLIVVGESGARQIELTR
jgi:photosystem II stability/assembly factor-like uncharacterized protein